MNFDKSRHVLLADTAHKARLNREEYPVFESQLRQEGITPFDVVIPDWPPAPKSKLMLIFGGGDPWEGENWTGVQPALDRSDYQSTRRAVQLSREMAGDGLSSKRLALRLAV